MRRAVGDRALVRIQAPFIAEPVLGARAGRRGRPGRHRRLLSITIHRPRFAGRRGRRPRRCSRTASRSRASTPAPACRTTGSSTCATTASRSSASPTRRSASTAMRAIARRGERLELVALPGAAVAVDDSSAGRAGRDRHRGRRSCEAPSRILARRLRGRWHRAVRGSAMASTAESVCPLDCPDTCSLAVTVEDGRVTAVDGSQRNPLTDGFICAKVRRYPERVYSPLRVLHPQRRVGAKGEARFERISWDDAHRADRRALPAHHRRATAARRSCRITTAARTACSARARPTRASSTASAPRSC